MEASRSFSSHTLSIPPDTPPIIVRVWQAIELFYANPRQFEPPTYAQLSELLFRADPDKAFSEASIFRAHRARPDLLPWPVRRGMRPPWDVTLQIVDTYQQLVLLDLDWVHVSWSCDDLGSILCCSDSLPPVLGYSKDEVVGHPGTRILVPSARSGDPRIVAIWEAMQRLRRGETTEEPISEHLEARDGSQIECHAVMTYRVVQSGVRPIWDVVADVRRQKLTSD